MKKNIHYVKYEDENAFYLKNDMRLFNIH